MGGPSLRTVHVPDAAPRPQRRRLPVRPGAAAARRLPVGFGTNVFPDTHAVGRRGRPQHLYTVAFEAADLWGDRAEPGTEMRVDLYEPYLEATRTTAWPPA
ncbi:MAG: SH3-like domain-containing protein [Ilumatobacteraceae bacterium]